MGWSPSTSRCRCCKHDRCTRRVSHIAGQYGKDDGRTTEQRLADGLIELASAYAKGEVNGGRENPNLLITIPATSLTGDSDEPGYTSWGDRIPAFVARRLAEFANLQRVVMAGSHVLDLGRTVRYATDRQYEALVARDGGCREPGCTIPPAWCQIDHLHDWILGGETDLDNLVLWCTFHHHQKHLPGVIVLGNANNLRLQMPDGFDQTLPTQDADAELSVRENRGTCSTTAHPNDLPRRRPEPRATHTDPTSRRCNTHTGNPRHGAGSGASGVRRGSGVAQELDQGVDLLLGQPPEGRHASLAVLDEHPQRLLPQRRHPHGVELRRIGLAHAVGTMTAGARHVVHVATGERFGGATLLHDGRRVGLRAAGDADGQGRRGG